MSQPLVTRPPYGEDRLAESGLPKGEPAGKGLSLDSDIPGSSTFSHPSEEAPREQRKDDESMYRVDNADDLLKEQTRPDEIDHSDARPTYRRPGPHDGPGKTKYPYRDGIPNTHNASLAYRVAHNYLAEIAPERQVSLEGQVKVAVRLAEIEKGLNPKTVKRSKSCKAALKRADTKNLRWLFSVDCGNGPKTVKLKASRKGRVTALSKMDTKLSCSCDAWRWLGSEHHSKKEKYLDGKPVGTATPPVVKDPLGVNRVCKHVAAVIGVVRKWQVPVK